MDQIKGPLDSLLKELKVRVRDTDPEKAVAECFSGKEAEHARFRSLAKGVLRISVDSSTWMYYFNLHKKRLMQAVTARLPEVKEIVFLIGEIN